MYSRYQADQWGWYLCRHSHQSARCGMLQWMSVNCTNHKARIALDHVQTDKWNKRTTEGGNGKGKSKPHHTWYDGVDHSENTITALKFLAAPLLFLRAMGWVLSLRRGGLQFTTGARRRPSTPPVGEQVTHYDRMWDGRRKGRGGDKMGRK